MKRIGPALVLGLALFLVPRVVGATPILTSCPVCDGSKYALTYSLESDVAGTATYDVTLWADTSGNTLGASALDAVAVGMNKTGFSVLPDLDGAPNGAANWTVMPGGLNGSGCDSAGAPWMCAKANSAGYAAPTPSATLYTWTWDITVPDSFVFAATGGVKVHYTTVRGHLVSYDFAFQQGAPPPPPVPEPASLILLGSGLCLTAWRARATKRCSR